VKWKAKRDPKYVKNVAVRMQGDIVKYVGSKAPGEITRMDVVKLIQDTDARGARDIAKRNLQFIRRIYDYGLNNGLLDQNTYLVVGERVRIKAGVMAGVEGVLVRKKNDLRVVLSLETIMQSVAVEVDADDVEQACGFGEHQTMSFAVQAPLSDYTGLSQASAR